MLFNSIDYFYLVLGCFFLYWCTPSLKIRQLIVLVSSIYFYMSWSKVFIFMLLAMIFINWMIGRVLGVKREKKWIWLACFLNLGILAYFKYMNFFLDNVQGVIDVFDSSYELPHLSIILPLGVSFYIFELISYQVDIYRGKIDAEKSLIVFSIFVLFFPHLIAGPICRAGQFIPQIRTYQKADLNLFYRGGYFFLCGFAIKCGIADGLAPFVNVIFSSPEGYSGFDNLMAVIGFGVQILCDFWGYSLMALGSALLFGYKLPHNFNSPYCAKTIQDFWRRWHMTLSSWLRDYLYISLGGSRTVSSWKIQRNLALTMLLGGLWHGASWNFIIWGAIHGIALIINRSFSQFNGRSIILMFFRFAPISWLLTMLTVFVSWIFFRAENLDVSMLFLHQILSPSIGWFDTKLSMNFFELIILYFPLQYFIHRTTYTINIDSQPVMKAAFISSLLVIFSFVYYVNGTDFIYFQF